MPTLEELVVTVQSQAKIIADMVSNANLLKEINKALKEENKKLLSDNKALRRLYETSNLEIEIFEER